MWECASGYAPSVNIGPDLHCVDVPATLFLCYKLQMEGIQKHFPAWKNSGHGDLSPNLGAEILGIDVHRCVHIHIFECVYVMILMAISIQTCHASIWILLSEHMSGKSVPGNRIRAQMMSFCLELTCHLSDCLCMKLWGHAYTQTSLRCSKGKIQTVPCIELHTPCSFLTFPIYVRTLKY